MGVQRFAVTHAADHRAGDAAFERGRVQDFVKRRRKGSLSIGIRDEEK